MGLAISLPIGVYARITPWSSLALEKSIDVGAGVIDSDYGGELGPSCLITPMRILNPMKEIEWSRSSWRGLRLP